MSWWGKIWPSCAHQLGTAWKVLSSHRSVSALLHILLISVLYATLSLCPTLATLATRTAFCLSLTGLRLTWYPGELCLQDLPTQSTGASSSGQWRSPMDPGLETTRQKSSSWQRPGLQRHLPSLSSKIASAILFWCLVLGQPNLPTPPKSRTLPFGISTSKQQLPSNMATWQSLCSYRILIGWGMNALQRACSRTCARLAAAQHFHSTVKPTWQLSWVFQSFSRQACACGKQSLCMRGLKVEWNFRMLKAWSPRKLPYPICSMCLLPAMFLCYQPLAHAGLHGKWPDAVRQSLFYWIKRQVQNTQYQERNLKAHILWKKWNVNVQGLLPLPYGPDFSYFNNPLLNG